MASRRTVRELAAKIGHPVGAVLRKLRRIGFRVENADDELDDQEVETFLQDGSTPRVFIVHGHDKVRRMEVSSFVASLKLVPITLADEPSEGKTVIEKLVDNGGTAFAIVLLTPDDEGRLRKRKTGKREVPLQQRARQNVIFEMGYFVARLGRGKVCALFVPPLEIPSDIEGVIKIRFDRGEKWKSELQKELAKARLL